MADERSKDEEAPEDEATPEAPAPAKKADLRVSSHQDLGVSVSRDLNAGGWLARGDRSNMSKLKFSVQAKPRDELDPELQALRTPVPAEPAVPPVRPPDAAAESPPPTPDPGESSDGMLARLGRLFRSE